MGLSVFAVVIGVVGVLFSVVFGVVGACLLVLVFGFFLDSCNCWIFTWANALCDRVRVAMPTCLAANCSLVVLALCVALVLLLDLAVVSPV